MINKQNLWFITLFSLIIILCVYYVSIPEKSLVSMVSNTNSLSEVIEINEADVLIALKALEEEKILSAMETATEQLLNDSSSIKDKNEAYLKLQSLKTQKGQMQKIEKILKDKFNINTCVVINDNTINITVSGKDLGIDKVNQIINEVQKLYDDQKYITVKFQK